MSKNLSGKYWKNKENFRKKLVKGIKIFLKKSKKKCKNLDVSKIKLSLVEYRKKYYKKRKNRPASQIKIDWCFSTSNRVEDFFWISF